MSDEFYVLVWYSKWRPWERCKAVGRDDTLLYTMRCQLKKNHDYNCAMVEPGSWTVLRWRTHWTHRHH